MEKNTYPKVREIDNRLKDEIRAIDFSGKNLIEEDYVLVMDNAPIVQRYTFDAPLRSREHRVMLVMKGSVDHRLNFTDHHTSEGELLMIPANYIIEVKDFSASFNARVLSFRFSDMADAALVGYEVVHLRLGPLEQRVFDSFFQMMHMVLTSPISGRRDFEHLVLSMLMRIRGLDDAQHGKKAPAFADQRQELFARFMQLVNQPDQNLPRLISAYAESLGTSGGHLGAVVKDLSGRTVMDWVDLKSVTLIKALLLDPSSPTVDQIAGQLNFSSSSQLIRFFKKMTGTTPAEYRKEKLQAMYKK